MLSLVTGCAGHCCCHWLRAVQDTVVSLVTGCAGHCCCHWLSAVQDTVVVTGYGLCRTQTRCCAFFCVQAAAALCRHVLISTRDRPLALCPLPFSPLPLPPSPCPLPHAPLPHAHYPLPPAPLPAAPRSFTMTEPRVGSRRMLPWSAASSYRHALGPNRFSVLLKDTVRYLAAPRARIRIANVELEKRVCVCVGGWGGGGGGGGGE